MDNRFTALSEHIFDEVAEFRRHLHAHPELSFKETATAKYISQRLTAEGIEHRAIAGTGILAKIEGCGSLRNAVVLRADIDALPVTECTGAAFSSRHDGVMHACGHDMHAAALFGALKILNSMRSEIEGTVFGVFQPGEECNPGGATLVLAENPFDGYDIKAFIGQHIEPQLPTGVFGFRAGKYMASSDELRFTVCGVGGHGAMRKNIKDPVLTAAEIISALHSIPASAPDKNAATVLSIGRVTADGATNIIPDKVYMEGTMRVFDERWRAQVKTRINEICSEISARHGTSTIVNIGTGYPCVVNDPTLTVQAAELARQMFSERAVCMLDLRPTAEDFGFYTQRYPALFYRLGAGENALDTRCCSPTPAGKLHTARLLPNENALRYGCAFMAALAAKQLQPSQIR